MSVAVRGSGDRRGGGGVFMQPVKNSEQSNVYSITDRSKTLYGAR